MNSKAKLAAVAILPMFIGIMIGMSLEAAEAGVGAGLTDKRIGAKTPKNYGAMTSGIVCGDRLCSEATPSMDIEEHHEIQYLDEHDPETPTTKLIDIRKYKPSTNKADAITYIITYSLTAGTEDLENIQIHVSSDVQEDTYTIGSLNSLKSSVNVIRIKALDPDSIDGGIVSYSVVPPTYDPRNPQLGQ
jgi:hypothetical protein